ncbi:hypothetical protein M440DRAFT_1431880, partial [Trichoderma longibrachiatum ATCC 18648]
SSPCYNCENALSRLLLWKAQVHRGIEALWRPLSQSSHGADAGQRRPHCERKVSERCHIHQTPSNVPRE